MSLKTTLIVGGLAAALGTGAAFAQSYSDNPAPSQEAPYGHHHRHGHHHGVLALIREEMSAGRISQREGKLLEQRNREIRHEKHAERQARNEGMRGGDYGRGGYGQGYEQANPPPPPSQQSPQPR